MGKRSFNPAICTDCGNNPVGSHGGHGRCTICNNRRRRISRTAMNIPCAVDGCEGTVTSSAGNICERHRAQMRRHGRIVSVERMIGHRATKMKDYAPMRARILAEQGGVCALCMRASNEWHIDHDHSCCGRKDLCEKCVRGVLCRNCNIGLGMFRDDVALLESVIAYLQR